MCPSLRSEEALMHFSKVLVEALVLALLAGGCTPPSPPPKPVVSVAIDSIIPGSDRSWSWSLLPGTEAATPVAVGLDRRQGKQPTLEILVMDSLSHFERLSGLPKIEGSLLSASSARIGSSALILGQRVDESGGPHLFLLQSSDQLHWSNVQLSEDTNVVPTVIGQDDSFLYLASSETLRRVSGDGQITTLPAIALPENTKLISLSGEASHLWALFRVTGTESVVAAQSIDRGMTWGVPSKVESTDGENFTARGLLAYQGKALVSGGCGEEGSAVKPCLLSSDTGKLWSKETTFGGAKLRGGYFVTPSPCPDGSLLTAATAWPFSEGWPAQRSKDASWSWSRYDMVGSEVGVIDAIVTGPYGSGLVALISGATSTRIVTRNSVPTSNSVLDVSIGGPGDFAPWIYSSGDTWSEGSQFLSMRLEVQGVSSGGYFVLKKAIPVSLVDTSMTSTEWRAAQARSLDMMVTGVSGSKTVIAASEAPTSSTDLGRVRVYAFYDAAWHPIGEGLTSSFENQLAENISVSHGHWVLTTSYPIEADATTASHLFESTDGISWQEAAVPPQQSGKAPFIAGTCLMDQGQMVSVGHYAGQTTAAVWERTIDGWKSIGVPTDFKAISCAGLGETALMVSNLHDASSIWVLRNGALSRVENLSGKDLKLQDILPLPGGIAVSGTQDRQGLSVPTVWFSSDGANWTARELGDASTVGTTGILAMMEMAGKVIVTRSSASALQAWEVAPPW
jgi:hypothetical protein